MKPRVVLEGVPMPEQPASARPSALPFPTTPPYLGRSRGFPAPVLIAAGRRGFFPPDGGGSTYFGRTPASGATVLRLGVISASTRRSAHSARPLPSSEKPDSPTRPPGVPCWCRKHACGRVAEPTPEDTAAGPRTAPPSYACLGRAKRTNRGQNSSTNTTPRTGRSPAESPSCRETWSPSRSVAPLAAHHGG